MTGQLKLDDLQSYGDLFPSTTIPLGVKREQRQSDRKPLEVEGTLMMDGSAIGLVTVDISLGGLCVRAKKQLPVGKECHVSFPLGVSDNGQTIAALVQVIYCFYTSEQDYKVGLHFLNVVADGMDEIRRLVNIDTSSAERNPG